MKLYKDIDNDSGVYAYEIGVDHITVQFKKGGTYNYSYKSAGKENVETMKHLAETGDGLNAYINKVVRNLYDWKK